VSYQDDHRETAKLNGKQRENLGGKERDPLHLTPTSLVALRNSFDARNGSAEPFYFFGPYDTNPKSSYDPTGVATVGRYTVRFNGDWQQSSGPGRSDV
jgi:hypothetical protein